MRVCGNGQWLILLSSSHWKISLWTFHHLTAPSRIVLFGALPEWVTTLHHQLGISSESRNKVAWHSLVWFPGRFPRAAFFLWLAVKEKLGTQDRLYLPAPGVLCLLCGTCLETHDHLFFECPATKQIWTRVLHKGNVMAPSLPWKEMVSWMTKWWNGNTFSTITKKLCIAITVYQIWKERNTRFHSNSICTTEAVYCAILEQVRVKLATFRRVEDNQRNRSLQTIWNLPDCIFGH